MGPGSGIVDPGCCDGRRRGWTAWHAGDAHMHFTPPEYHAEVRDRGLLPVMLPERSAQSALAFWMRMPSTPRSSRSRRRAWRSATFFDELDMRGAYVVLHPTAPPYDLPVSGHPPWVYEFPFETTRAIASLITADAPRLWPGDPLPGLASRRDDPVPRREARRSRRPGERERLLAGPVLRQRPRRRSDRPRGHR